MNLQTAVTEILEQVATEQAASSQHTYRWLGKVAVEYWGPETELVEITRKQVQAWVNKRREEVSPATVRIEASFLGRCFKAAVAAGVDISSLPTHGVKYPRINNHRTRVLLLEEQARLKAAMDPWDFSIVEFALNTGLRRLEVWRTRSNDAQLWKQQAGSGANARELLVGMLQVRDSKTGKGRSVPLNPIAANIAQQWMRRKLPYLFSPDGDKRLQAAEYWAAAIWRPGLKAAEIQGVGFHTLRHTFATRALQGGARLEQISWALGHASLEQTRSRYVHHDAQALWPAVMAVAKGGR